MWFIPVVSSISQSPSFHESKIKRYVAVIYLLFAIWGARLQLQSFFTNEQDMYILKNIYYSSVLIFINSVYVNVKAFVVYRCVTYINRGWNIN